MWLNWLCLGTNTQVQIFQNYLLGHFLVVSYDVLLYCTVSCNVCNEHWQYSTVYVQYAHKMVTHSTKRKLHHTRSWECVTNFPCNFLRTKSNLKKKVSCKVCNGWWWPSSSAVSSSSPSPSYFFLTMNDDLSWHTEL